MGKQQRFESTLFTFFSMRFTILPQRPTFECLPPVEDNNIIEMVTLGDSLRPSDYSLNFAQHEVCQNSTIFVKKGEFRPIHIHRRYEISLPLRDLSCLVRICLMASHRASPQILAIFTQRESRCFHFERFESTARLSSLSESLYCTLICGQLVYLC